MTGVDVRSWGHAFGAEVFLCTLTNGRGSVLTLTSLGASIVGLCVPDRDGAMSDVVLGLDGVDAYASQDVYLGAIVGRCAGRIAGARCVLDGTEVRLDANERAPGFAPNHLHGGANGFYRQVWAVSRPPEIDAPAVRFGLTSPDGDGGYPGRLDVAVTYVLTDDDDVEIVMEAMTTRATLCNLAQHAYWNLAGHGSGSVADHVLELFADRYTPADGSRVPGGRMESVEGTRFDFRVRRRVGDAFGDGAGGVVGLDHNFVVSDESGDVRPVAVLRDPVSGRAMHVDSDQPCVQVYTANALDGSIVGKGGAVYRRHAGVCLETQAFPNAINVDGWPAPVLLPGRRYRHRMTLRFRAED